MSLEIKVIEEKEEAAMPLSHFSAGAFYQAEIKEATDLLDRIRKESKRQKLLKLMRAQNGYQNPVT